MELNRQGKFVYGLLLVVWLLVLAWQMEEHVRVERAAQADLRNRSHEIAGTLSAVTRAMRFRGAVFQERLDPVLNELANSRSNAVASVSGLLAIGLLNNEGDPVVTAGDTNLLTPEVLAEREHWADHFVSFVLPIAGATVSPEGGTNSATVVLPSFRDLTNEATRDRELHRDDRNGTNAAAGRDDHARGGHRPPWMRWMSEDEFKAITARRELHGLVLAMSTENYDAICTSDLWLRVIIAFFATISALGAALAWRGTGRAAELQIRLVRASEQNAHLKELNLAAAGLAHETRNPLNLIRGQAQLISRLPAATAEVREKSRTILDETDKVTAQLTEFINYSRPREVRRTKISLAAAGQEIIRTLGHDLDEKRLTVEVVGEPLAVEADEQLLRQVLFNLLLNAIQAADAGGRIQVAVSRAGAAEAVLEVRDDGPGVPPEQRTEVFKPYFTTRPKGTGLGLAVVQQIVLAHGWEIACLPNAPRGAVFRISHLKVA